MASPGTVLGVSALLHPLLLGMNWMDPEYLLDQFGTELLWISLAIIFVECGLFFPFLPGDTLLLSLGVFIATEDIDIFPGSTGVELVDRPGAAHRRRDPRQRGRATRSVAPSGRRSTSATAGC